MKRNCKTYDILSKFLKLTYIVVSEWLVKLFNRRNNWRCVPWFSLSCLHYSNF